MLTTINVQHLESLNDVVGGLTGIRVWETVTDRMFDQADEVVLVDLPPDELLQRLKEGKVYLPEQAERAIENFFRKGNLIALRELALRRTADRVDDQVQHYQQLTGGPSLSTRDALLVCIGPEPGEEALIRAASRIASKLDAEWHALYVETPTWQRLPGARRRLILDTLKLAQDLGAHTATKAAAEVAPAIHRIRSPAPSGSGGGRSQPATGALARMAARSGWSTGAAGPASRPAGAGARRCTAPLA